MSEHFNVCAPAIESCGIDLSLPRSDGSKVEILRQIDFEVAVGQRIGLIGPSGSGKTSLLTVLAGLQRPTAGRIKVFGQSYQDQNEEQLASFRRDNIGIVFQNFHLLPAMTALENVALPLEIASRPNPDMRAAEALEVVGLKHRLDHYPHQLSGGEQQRTAIARAFVAQPRLILADEPTGNLDSETGSRVIDILLQLAAESSATLLLITHNNALLDLFPRVLNMRDGCLREG